MVSGPAKAETNKTIWSCKAPYTQDNILWLVEWGGKSYVKVFGERLPARYSMQGLAKRWDWGADGKNGYNYAVVLEPKLTASYYNFSTSKDGTANSSATYKCSK